MYLLRARRGLLFSLSGYLLLFAAMTPLASAQAAATDELEELAAISTAASINDSGPAGTVPAMHGFNMSLGTSSQHDSADGWSSILNPNAAYRFSPHFSVSADVPMYLYINIDANVGTKAKPVYRYSPKQGVFGDTVLSFEGDASALTVGYSGTVSLGLPSGSTNYGLGAGQVTYNLNNRFERSLGLFMPDIELGYGDTSNLVDQRVLKSYVAVGPMAYFQAGTSVLLPRNISFEADAYEELPLAKNLVYSTTGKGKKKVTTSTNEAPSEDNGFITSLDIPLAPHLILSGLYNRSLRDHDDVAGFSFTFLLKAPPKIAEAAN